MLKGPIIQAIFTCLRIYGPATITNPILNQKYFKAHTIFNKLRKYHFFNILIFDNSTITTIENEEFELWYLSLLKIS